MVERVRNSGKKFIFFFLLALVSVLVPVLHFVLVPVFLILAFVMGYQGFKMSDRIHTKDCLCAHCNQQLKDSYLVGADLRFRCDSCGSQFIVSGQR